MQKFQHVMVMAKRYSSSGCNNSTAGGKLGVALVVGAGPGIGAALVRKLMNEGMTVCAVRRNEDKLQPLLHEIRNNNNNNNNNQGSCEGIACDSRKEDQVVALVEDIEQRLGPIELAVHNIGANIGKVALKDTTARQYTKLWEMGTFSAFCVGKEVGKRMEARGRGTIIFTGATASLRGGSGFSAFSGSCMAKRALAQSMARELGGRGVHVAHVIVDGVVDNPNTRDYFGWEEKFQQMAAVDQLLRPDDIADNYWNLHMQARNAWTHELDLRPWNEKW